MYISLNTLRFSLTTWLELIDLPMGLCMHGIRSVEILGQWIWLPGTLKYLCRGAHSPAVWPALHWRKLCCGLRRSVIRAQLAYTGTRKRTLSLFNSSCKGQRSSVNAMCLWSWQEQSCHITTTPQKMKHDFRLTVSSPGLYLWSPSWQASWRQNAY